MTVTVTPTDKHVPREPGQPQLVGYLVKIGERTIPVAALDAQDAERIARQQVK